MLSYANLFVYYDFDPTPNSTACSVRGPRAAERTSSEQGGELWRSLESCWDDVVPRELSSIAPSTGKDQLCKPFGMRITCFFIVPEFPMEETSKVEDEAMKETQLLTKVEDASGNTASRGRVWYWSADDRSASSYRFLL